MNKDWKRKETHPISERETKRQTQIENGTQGTNNFQICCSSLL